MLRVERRIASGARFAVLSDIHANAAALAEALRRIDAEGIECAVVLGDILTYGCAPVEVLELLRGRDFLHVRGNHDAFYGRMPEVAHGAPAFLRESIAWTRARIGTRGLPEAADEIVVDPMLFSHANPFGAGDWTYLDDYGAAAAAAEALRRRKLRVGFFGHTHRPSIRIVDAVGQVTEQGLAPGPVEVQLDRGVALVNPGSLGQPRGSGSSFATARLVQGRLSIDHQWIDYDEQDHCDAITASGMSPATCARLLGYFGR